MPIPTLTLRLLDVKVPREPDTQKLLLLGAKDLARENIQLFEEHGLDIDLFHNSEVCYSGIQLGRFHGKAEWTAIGTPSVKALHIWFELFKGENPHLLQNVVEIRETYTPEFLPFAQKYLIQTLLVNDETAKELNDIQDKFARYDRLEKYLYGNLQTFFKHIGFEHDKEANFLKINVLDANYHNTAHTVFHDRKKSAFKLIFTCNFRLPQTARLGQSTALGFGTLRHLK